jgi:toxin FitB
MFLLDTNVISETRRPRPHGAVVAWIASNDARQLRIPAIAIGEIQSGIERTRRSDAAKAAEFDLWLTRVMDNWQIVPMDGETFRIWARLMVGKQSHLIADAMIAATALQHGLTVATRNVDDFMPFEVATFDPFTFAS